LPRSYISIDAAKERVRPRGQGQVQFIRRSLGIVA
jgi:hypothetical protein